MVFSLWECVATVDTVHLKEAEFKTIFFFTPDVKCVFESASFNHSTDNEKAGRSYFKGIRIITCILINDNRKNTDSRYKYGL